MKHNQKLLGLVGIILACNLCLAACQSQPSQQESSKDKVKTKQEVKKKSKATKKGQVPGVDKPTDDGFLFKSESQIKARTSEGLILEHDGHTHFIFYSDLKNSKWAYLIPKDGQVPAGSPQLANQMSTADDGYVFNPRDIVSEDQYGYVVRHGDHFHYILKQSVGNLAQAPSYRPTPSSNTTGPVYQPTPTPSLPQQQGTTKRQFAGIDYPTSDGFLFRGTGVTGKLATGLLADHNGHTHFIPYEQLIASPWESLIPAEHKKAAEDAYYGRQGQAQPSPKPSPAPAPTPEPAPNPLDEEEEIAKKKAYLAQQLGIDESLIQVSDTDKGKVFIYPHGDHSHSTLVSEIDTTKPFDPHGNPHAHDAVGMATLKALGFDDEIIEDIIEDILHATADTPFPSNETNTEKMKAWLATVKYLNIGQRKDPLERKGLELMPNIEVLGIGFTPIKDIRPVLQFKHLKQLWMTKTGVTNYDFLKEIPTLEGLDISQNGITDLSFLKDYPNLKTVAAAGNDLTDISPLAKLKNLESLNLDYNNISDISALTKLSKLKAVSLEHNQLHDISALSQKEDLTRLFLSNNPNLNLNTLKASHLEELTADNSNVESLNFLKSNPNLTTLSLNGNRLTSLAGVEAAKNLVTLSASQNKITSLNIPAAQSSLKNLNLAENELKNLKGINQFRTLDNLAVNKNKITTLALQEPNKTVTYINVSDNHIPKEELELNENKIPKALAQHFPDVQGGSIDNNKPADEKDEKKVVPKESEPNKADVQGKPASAEASNQGASNDSEHEAGSPEEKLDEWTVDSENSSKPSSEEVPTAENPELKDELAQAENKENQKDPKDKEKAEKEASH